MFNDPKTRHLNLIFKIILMTVVLSQLSCSGMTAKSDSMSYEEFVEVCAGHKAVQSDLLKVLSGRDAVASNAAVLFSIQYGIALNANAVYKAIWSGETALFPSLDMKYLNQPVVRLAVAAALATFNPHQKDDYRHYVLSQLAVNDDSVKKYAIVAVGYVGDKPDIQRLREIMLAQSNDYLPDAASAMLMIDEVLAVAALEELAEEMGSESEKGKLIEAIIKPYQEPGRLHRCGHH